MSPAPGHFQAFGSPGSEGPRLGPAEAPDRPLTVPLLVRGALDNRALQALLWVAGGLLAVGLCIFFQHPGKGRAGALGFFAGALLFGAPGLALLLYLLPRRLWLQVTLTGMVVTRRGVPVSYADDQVVGLARDSTTRQDGSVSHQVGLDLERGGSVERLACAYHLGAGQADALAGLWDRLAARLARRAREGLGRGEALAGPGWRLDAQGLRGGGEVTAPQRLRKVGYFDGQLCVWRDEEERPFLTLPRGGRNVQPLALLLWELIQANPEANRPLPGRPLGRVLLDRRSREWQLLLVLVLVLAPIMAFVAARPLLDPWPAHRAKGVGLALLFALLLACFGVLAVCSWLTRVRFHEYGVVQPGLWGWRVLMYDQIATMTCRGASRLVFAPAPGSGLPTVRYRSLNNDADEGLRALRDHVAWLIGQRWAAQLAERPVGWTLRLRFLPGGLEYRPWQLFGLAPAVVVPYQYTHYALVGEELHLHVQGDETPVCKESLAAPNFYPGLALLDRIYDGCKGGPPAADRAPAPRLPAPGGETRILGRDSRPGGFTTGT